MISKELTQAREYEAKEGAKVTKEERPVYHLSPKIGWLNDPNGFSFYNGQYHLFYQYYPFSAYWNSMHWGHAVSDDLIKWEYLPAALAPDTDYDGAGCFSGSAITLEDGRQLLIYTGCDKFDLDPDGKWSQTQCVAVSDPDSDEPDYIKYEKNPVITGKDLPEGGDPFEFRDPYIWKAADGSYRALVANGIESEPGKKEYKATKLIVFKSRDGFDWEFHKVMFEDIRRLGVMWECPNFFQVDDRHILIASPMDMQAEEANGSIRFPQGNNVCYIVGLYDEDDEEFIPYKDESGSYEYNPVDGGLDFYAPQVACLPDGRNVMVGWMQDPKMATLHEDVFKIFGQMTMPRELSLKEDKLIQWPVKELEAYRKDPVQYTEVSVGSEEIRLEGVRGRVLDLELEIRPEKISMAGTCSLDEFTIRFARDGEHFVSLSYRPDSSVVTIDRSHSGQEDNNTKRRSIRVRNDEGRIDIRLLLDRWSAEAFINGGEQVITATFYTDAEAQDVTFSAEGSAVMDVTKYSIG